MNESPDDPVREAAALIRMALQEDVAEGDFTTLWTVPAETEARATIVAKQPLVVSGGAIAARVFTTVEPRLDAQPLLADGSHVESGTAVMEIRGPARGVLTAERTALNFLGHLSGIATLTRRFVDAVAGTGARILDTRKTTPGWRTLEKRAVRDGGGVNHRHGLYDMVMIKDNHIAAAGGIEAAVARVRHGNRAALPVEVEVTTVSELVRVLPLGVDRVLLDNMSADTMRECVRRVRALQGRAPETEASGNVTLGTVRGVAQTGVDFISVGALTHSAPTADLSLRILS
ncbi:MAG: carboxylating nicotinate-nucleotide diphosphorylase [Gemmatimonadota bacterium]|nr:carboxylating nicotinate-nucleotide diphosphorylase [Gemmatimonadota bacterium]